MPAECMFFIATLFLFYKATIDNRFGILQNFSNFCLICSLTIAVGVLHSFKPILHKIHAYVCQMHFLANMSVWSINVQPYENTFQVIRKNF